MSIDPNAAPEGYIAIEHIGCTGCAFSGDAAKCAAGNYVPGRICGPLLRADHTSVIFIKKPKKEESMQESTEEIIKTENLQDCEKVLSLTLKQKQLAHELGILEFYDNYFWHKHMKLPYETPEVGWRITPGSEHLMDLKPGPITYLDPHQPGVKLDQDWDRSKQVGGTHYNSHKIQPWHVIDEYNLPYYSGAALKYILREKSDKVEDLEKAIHCLEHQVFVMKQKAKETK
jgi:hypothetical protein